MAKMDRKPAGSPAPRWLRLLLAISLALNLLVIGLAAGAVLRHGGKPPSHLPTRLLGAVMFRELPASDRRALRSMFTSQISDALETRHADARALGDALRSVPFDPSGVTNVLDAQAGRRLAFQEDMQQAWLTRVAAMPDAVRRDYADRLQSAMTRARHSESGFQRRGPHSGGHSRTGDR